MSSQDNLFILEHNAETNKITTIPTTEEELNRKLSAQQLEILAQKELLKQANDEAKEAARQAVLTKLGLTSEEAQALLG